MRYRLLILLFFLSNGLALEDHRRNDGNSANDPLLYLSSRRFSNLLPDDALFDQSDVSSIRRHDLARCPPTAEPDPASNDLNLLLNITDPKNQTSEEEDLASLEFNKEKIVEPDTPAEPSPPTPDTPEERPQTPPPIATFEEWTKEKLLSKEKRPPMKETQNGLPVSETTVPNVQPNSVNSGTNTEQTAPTPPNTQPPINAQETPVQSPPILTDPSTATLPPTQVTKRNYASKECGAKVLMANDEAEHRNAVLNDKERDEYMRNPCERAQQKFLIIELCETIQPNFLEIANFELFSSGPRDIHLSVSERYPTLEWTPVGQFVAADTREMQSFEFNSPGVYAKFIKLDLLSHYGKEHYCTLTTVRLSGISIVDEYEAEASNSLENVAATIIQSPVQVPVQASVEQPVQPTQPTQQSIESPILETTPQTIEAEQKVDPSNESHQGEKGEKKAFVLNKVVDIVGKQLKDVIGKTLLGNRSGQRIKGRIWPNSCTDRCSLLEPETQSSLQCHYLDLIEAPAKRVNQKMEAPTVLEGKTQAQSQFLDAILPLSQCPTVLVEPKKDVKHEEMRHEEMRHAETKTEDTKHEEMRHEDTKHEETRHEEKKETKIETPIPTQQQFQPPKVPNSLPGTVSTHKESVFMKLNKRLSALELNMSLSSEYLSELSRRYVAQQDGYNKQHERDLKTLEEMVSRLGENLKSGWIDELNRIRTDLKDLAREMSHIKKTVRHIPPHFEHASSLSIIDHSNRPYHQNCYNMLPPANLPDQNTASWTNEQIVAVVTLSNLSAFTLFACVYLLYKILARRSRIQSKEFSQEEIRALVQREIEQLRRSMPQEAGQTADIETLNNTKVPSRRRKHRSGVKSASNLSIPTTSTSALDTMSSSASLSDLDQMDRNVLDGKLLDRKAPLIMDLLNEPNGRSDVSSNAVQKPSLSPPWKTVQTKRKLSDRSLKVPSRNGGKVKVN